MANDFTFNQISTILTDIGQMATGKKIIAPVNTSQFITVGQTLLQYGRDPILNAISTVLNRTIFSIRPYTRKFLSLSVSNQKFGGITRKLKIADKDWEKDQRYLLEEDKSVDMFRVKKPEILQLNFYGQNVYQRHYSIYKDQLDIAFTGPDQLMQFWSMVTQNCNDIIEQAKETLARAIVYNYIAGVFVSRPTSCIHLLTEYNAETGLTLTKQESMQPANFKAFTQWVYARISSISDMLTERTQLFQTNIVGKTINQHTPKSRQKIYLYTPFMYNIQTSAMSNTFHNDLVKISAHENVNYWQAVDSPDQIQAAPVYLNTDGTLQDGVATTIDNLFGIIFDEEAMGYTTVNTWSAPTPFNAAGGYWNIYFHFTERFWNDFTEKAVLLFFD